MSTQYYAPSGVKLLIYWSLLIWLQAPPIDPGFFGEWERLGVVGILVAVIAFGGWLFMRLLNHSEERGDKLEVENSSLTRQNEHMSLEAIGAVKELSAELKMLVAKTSELERQVALLLQRLEK